MKNQLNDVCAQRILRSASVSTQPDQSSLCGIWVAKDTNLLQADSKDSDWTEAQAYSILNWPHRSFFCFVVL